MPVTGLTIAGAISGVKFFTSSKPPPDVVSTCGVFDDDFLPQKPQPGRLASFSGATAKASACASGSPSFERTVHSLSQVDERDWPARGCLRMGLARKDEDDFAPERAKFSLKRWYVRVDDRTVG